MMCNTEAQLFYEIMQKYSLGTICYKSVMIRLHFNHSKFFLINNKLFFRNKFSSIKD